MKRWRDQRPGPHEYPGAAGQYLIAQPHQADRLTNAHVLARMEVKFCRTRHFPPAGPMSFQGEAELASLAQGLLLWATAPGGEGIGQNGAASGPVAGVPTVF